MELSGRKIQTVTALLAPVLLVLAAAFWWHLGEPDPQAVEGFKSNRGVIAVEVLNGTEIDGLARRVTRYLRRHGVDVLDYRQFRDSTIEQTLLLVRRGDSSLAAEMRTLLGTGRVVYEPDDRLLLDLTLLLGPDVLPLVRLDP